jgi:hypothetical protein
MIGLAATTLMAVQAEYEGQLNPVWLQGSGHA